MPSGVHQVSHVPEHSPLIALDVPGSPLIDCPWSRFVVPPAPTESKRPTDAATSGRRRDEAAPAACRATSGRPPAVWGVEEAWLFPNLHVSRSSHSPHHRATHAWWCDFLHVRICRCRPGDGMQCDARVRQGIARLSRPRTAYVAKRRVWRQFQTVGGARFEPRGIFMAI